MVTWRCLTKASATRDASVVVAEEALPDLPDEKWPRPGGEALRAPPGAVGEAPRDLPGAAGEALRALPGAVGEALRDLPGAVGEALRALPGAVGEALRALPGAVGEALRALPGAAGEVLRDLPGATGRVDKERGFLPERDLPRLSADPAGMSEEARGIRPAGINEAARELAVKEWGGAANQAQRPIAAKKQMISLRILWDSLNV